MTDERLARHPLLYIDQPIINSPKAVMQSSYHTPNEQDEKGMNKSFIREHEEESEKNNKTDATNFNHMSIKEQIIYLSETPEHVPKLKCILKTENGTYEGVITSFKEDDVYVRVGHRTTKITFGKIKSIHLLGF